MILEVIWDGKKVQKGEAEIRRTDGSIAWAQAYIATARQVKYFTRLPE